jgi:pSer/pThr/pTyr-binding forkhead associated (FHA) protein
MSRIWGKLTKTGGSEESLAVPSVITLFENDSFFGRISQAAPRSDVDFKHTSQFVIPCMYISSTHFSLHYDPNSSTKYLIRDYSKNGTFVNNQLVGTTEAKELKDNDEISLKYKDKVKIIYQFSIVEESVVPPPVSNAEEALPSQFSKKSNQIVNNNNDSPHHALKKQDSTSDIFTQQINHLQQEMKKLENKLSLTNDHLDLLNKENEKLLKKSKQDDKSILSLKTEKEELADRFMTMDSNYNALAARNSILQDNYDDLLTESKDYKNKNTFYQAEIQEKNSSIENVRTLLDDSNKILASEKRTRIHLETIIQDLKTKFILYEEKHLRLVTANQALQEIVSELELDKARLEVNESSTVKFHFS